MPTLGSSSVSQVYQSQDDRSQFSTLNFVTSIIPTSPQKQQDQAAVYVIISSNPALYIHDIIIVRLYVVRKLQ